jgi:hypothetical protein
MVSQLFKNYGNLSGSGEWNIQIFNLIYDHKSIIAKNIKDIYLLIIKELGKPED